MLSNTPFLDFQMAHMEGLSVHFLWLRLKEMWVAVAAVLSFQMVVKTHPTDILINHSSMLGAQ
jgi:hypothetical protein